MDWFVIPPKWQIAVPMQEPEEFLKTGEAGEPIPGSVFASVLA